MRMRRVKSLTGRAALEAYWRPRLAIPRRDPLPWTTWRRRRRGRDAGLSNYEGKPVRIHFRFNLTGKSYTRCRPLELLRRLNMSCLPLLPVCFIIAIGTGPGFFDSRTMMRSLRARHPDLRSTCAPARLLPHHSRTDSPRNLTKCPSLPTKYTRYSVTRSPQRMVAAHQTPFGNKWQWPCVNCRGLFQRRVTMPVLLLWAIPAVIFVGGVGYFLVHATH